MRTSPRPHPQRVRFGVSEPWEFESELGAIDIDAIVVDSNPAGWLLRLVRPVTFRDVRIEYVVALPRHEGTPLDHLSCDLAVAVNLTPVSPDDVRAGRHTDAAKRWRAWHLAGGMTAAD